MSSNVTIQSFALEIKISVDSLIQKFLNIGIKKNRFDFVTQTEKAILLKYIHDNIKSINKFSLRRQTRSTLHILSTSGKNKQVQVEVRKKQVYMIPNIEKKSDSDLLDNNDCLKLNHKNQSNISQQSVTMITHNESVNSDLSNLKHDLLCNKTEKHNKCISTIIDHNHKINIKTHSKIHDKSQKIINKKQQLIKNKSTCSSLNKKSFIHFTHNQFDKTKQLSVLDINNNDDYPTNYNKRYKAKLRSKGKTIGRLFKQNKNNFQHDVCDIFNNGVDTKEKLFFSYSVNKNNSKKSTLIQGFNRPTQTIVRNVVIGEKISVLELSNKMSVKSSYMIKLMMRLGLTVTINQVIDQETAQLIIEEMGHNAILRREDQLEELVMHDNRKYKNHSFNDSQDHHVLYKNRAPVVAIMGHVDHGKTSLLDYIRSTKVVSSELGGITQSIGAYSVTTKNGKLITFLDTPGHEAFVNMRIRGAQLTDIAILVIAADDGVMPQTLESIQHIKSISIPAIIAINKIDKLGINTDRIKHDLNRYGFIPEEWGGNTPFINVSAISGIGINNLLDAILLQSEVLELKTAHQGMAKAIVIESSVDKNRGPIVIVLIKEGELKCGDIILCGTEYGRVRAIRDEYGDTINIAGPSMPVEILGLSGVPNAGDQMVVVHNEKKARELALYRKDKQRVSKLAARKQEEPTAAQVFDSIHNHKTVELSFIIKSDTQGSMEAVCDALIKLSSDKIIIKVLCASIGNITETDAILASTSHAVILGFNVKSDSVARRIIELYSLNVRYYSIIYDLLNEVQNMIHSNTSNSLAIPNIIGIAEVHNIFRSPTYGTIAGCVVIEGIIKSRKKIMVFRDHVIIHKGELESLRRFKNDVNEVKVGMECGIVIKNYHDLKLRDIIKTLDNVMKSSN